MKRSAPAGMMDHRKVTETRIKRSQDGAWLQQLCRTLSAEVLSLELRLQGEEDTHSALASLMRAALRRVGNLHAVATARLGSLNLEGSLPSLLASVPPTSQEDDLPHSLEQLAQQRVLSGSSTLPPSHQAESLNLSSAKWRAANPEYIKQKNAKYYAANPEYVKQKNAEYYTANQESIKIVRHAVSEEPRTCA